MPVRGPGPYQLRKLSARLREAGEEGKGLRRELYKAVSAAARPLAAEIKNVGHLRPYMPDRYADVLAADMSVTTVKRTGRDPGVAIKAKGRAKPKRHLKRLDGGKLLHPLFGDRERWFAQTKAVHAGFFTDPARRAAPGIRREVLAAMHETGKKITS